VSSIVAGERDRLSPLQRMTIDRLRQGQEKKVPVTLTAEARADALLAARVRAREAGDHAITVTALVAFVLVRTLAEDPALNVALVDDDSIVRYAEINLGIAVALPDDNLAVPVIHSAQKLTLGELGAAIVDLTEKARTKTLDLEDVHGGTFTLSSTGSVGLPIFGTPLLVPGQSGILLVGAAAEKAVADGGRTTIASVLPLSLTFDHAVVNGIPALRFLAKLVIGIERLGSAEA
jgi:pyruvate dehydrogenase E2 component (dihydrolipoyllysine-residue acetyltransferase)